MGWGTACCIAPELCVRPQVNDFIVPVTFLCSFWRPIMNHFTMCVLRTAVAVLSSNKTALSNPVIWNWTCKTPACVKVTAENTDTAVCSGVFKIFTICVIWWTLAEMRWELGMQLCRNIPLDFVLYSCHRYFAVFSIPCQFLQSMYTGSPSHYILQWIAGYVFLL